MFTVASSLMQLRKRHSINCWTKLTEWIYLCFVIMNHSRNITPHASNPSELCLAAHLLKLLFWRFFLKIKKKKKSTSQIIEIKLYLLSSSVPDNKNWVNKLMALVWLLDRQTLFPPCNPELKWAPKFLLIYRIGLTLPKTINYLSSLPTKK